MTDIERKSKAILFSPDMMRAIRSGIKVQTRRVVYPQPIDVDEVWPNLGSCVTFGDVLEDLPYYLETGICHLGKVGDYLWTRENWRTIKAYNHLSPTKIIESNQNKGIPPYVALEYSDNLHYAWPIGEEPGKWRPGRFMPRVFSRCLLEITAIRLEKLHQITRTDCMREGIKWSPGQRSEPLIDFAILWDSIHKEEEYTWASNPYVWVISFELRANELMDEEVGETLQRVNFSPRPNKAQIAKLVQRGEEMENG